MSLPRVTIVIPVYNGAAYLKAAINSALNQTYKNIEIIVVNDGSTDQGASEAIALSFGEKIRYFSKSNGGVASALNFAISKMAGDFFSWLSHDDLYYPEKIEKQIGFLRSHNLLDKDVISYSDFCLFYQEANFREKRKMKAVPPEDFRYFLLAESSLHGCTLLIPRRAFVQCGGFREDLKTTQDYDMWFRLSSAFSFVHIPEALIESRVHPEQGSVTMKNTAWREVNDLLISFIKELSPEQLYRATGCYPELAYAKLASRYRQRGLLEAARTASRLSLKYFGAGSIASRIRTIEVLCVAHIIGTPLSILRRPLSVFRYQFKKVFVLKNYWI